MAEFPGANMKHLTRALLASTIVLTLAACSDEEASTPAVDAPTASSPTPEETAKQAERDQALDQVREGARSITEGAGTLFDQGREAASRALDDAGPALETAGELTREVARIAKDAADKTAADIRDATAELNRRIEESQTEVDVETGDSQARLSSVDLLNADTKAAARARPAGVGPDYVGVWAGDAAQCARIDQEPVEQMAVITPTTIRRYESVCNMQGAPLVDGSTTLAASCIAEGETEQRQITLTMPSTDQLQIGFEDGVGQSSLVRCQLAG